MVQVTVLFHIEEFLVFGLTKTETGAKPLLGGKTGLLRRAGAKTEFPGDTRNVGGVICHMRVSAFKMILVCLNNY